ncbi:hypothetical protein [Nocardia rhizosphaerihabitans]|uniref:hypothetical protein n=1 Tax=Nocardia rhizosphaerihabitans TaxID=1691570 RepID=UPI00166B2396|nr:hypothetical protein [Nocardia rhizosphaerihabitans]
MPYLPGHRHGAAYTVGHLEPITMQRTLSPRGEAVNLMVATPGTAAFLNVLRTDIDRGKLTNEPPRAKSPTQPAVPDPASLTPLTWHPAAVLRGRDRQHRHPRPLHHRLPRRSP